MYKIKDFTTSGFSMDIPVPSPDIFKGTKAEDVAKRNPELFKQRHFSSPPATARAGLYALWDIKLWNELKQAGKNTNYETAGGLVSISDLPGGSNELELSDFPEDAKEMIKKHFQKELKSK